MSAPNPGRDLAQNLKNHPRMMGGLFVLLTLLSSGVQAAAAGGCAVNGP